MIAGILKENWDTGLNNAPTITYNPQNSMMVNASLGNIHIERLTRTNSIDTVDYRTLGRSSYLSIRIACPLRKTMFSWSNEVYRILMQYRRAGPDVLNGWEFLEIQSERPMQDLSGWFSTTFDIKLTRPHQPLESDGFGPKRC